MTSITNMFAKLARKVLYPNHMNKFIIRRWKSRKTKPYHLVDPSLPDDLPVMEYVGRHSTPDIRVFIWGNADHGALGRASFVRPGPRQIQMKYMQHPHRVEFGEYHKVTDVACGYGFTIFATKDDLEASCFGTGINTDCQLGYHAPRKGYPLGLLIQPTKLNVPLANKEKVIKVACGRAHTVMLTNFNSVLTVGNNSYGQCGRPIIEHEDYGKKAVYIKLKNLEEERICQIVCGQDCSYFVSESGTVFSCGWGADGQTGQGHYSNASEVRQVIGDVEGERIIKVACRADCVLALNDKGELFGWGNNEYQQLNSVTEEPQIHTAKRLPMHGVGKVTDVAVGGTICLVVNEKGEVYSWGFGPVGIGPEVTFAKDPKLIPMTLFGRNVLNENVKVTAVFAGISFLACVNSDGILYTWGKNPGGVLGLGHQKDHYFPLRVSMMGFVKHVSCGVDHIAALVREII